MSTIRPEFHTSIVSQILNDIFYKRSNYYYFLGKIDPWGASEEVPVAPNNSFSNDITIRDNLLYLRKIVPTDVSLVTKSYIWESGTVYDFWDDKIEMQDKTFYVVNDEYNVYKCLDNNNNAVSTEQPTSNSLFPFRSSDGYLWKYMYNIPPFKRQKFLSRGYLPVQKALTDTFYNKGAIESVAVTNPGSGYTDEQLTSITVSGTTSGSGAVVSINSVDSIGKITGMTITEGGIEYDFGAQIQIISGSGSGAIIVPVIENGVITALTIEDGGIGYTTADTVNVVVGGAVLIPAVSRETGSIEYVKIINGGAGYSSTATLTIEQIPESGTGLYGNPGAILTPVVYNGSIVRVLIEDPGVGYPFDTNTSITVIGDGTGAEFTPVINNGELVDIIVNNSGSGYSYISLTITGTGSGAAATAILGSSDFLSDQSQVEQVSVSGAIYKIVVTEQGENYSEESTLVISGDGFGAAGYPVIEDGKLVNIVMTEFGQSYTYATFDIVDPNRPTPNDYINMTAYAVFPPSNGHGYDAVKELYGDTLCIYNLVRGDKELELIAQDYRQYGILVNPVDNFSNKKITDNTNIISFKLTVSGAEMLNNDEILICNGVRYRIVSVQENIVEVQQLNVNYTQPYGYFYKESDPYTNYSIQTIISVPTANKYSGNLLYVTNNTPFTPTSEQTIAIRTFIKI